MRFDAGARLSSAADAAANSDAGARLSSAADAAANPSIDARLSFAEPGVQSGGVEPQPSPMAAYFSALAPTWDDTARASPVQPAVVRIAGVGPGSRVLDLGCGTGIMAPFYLDAGAREVVALDVAPGMIARAQEKFADEPRVDFRCADALSFEDEEGFDAVVVYNAYPHFLDRAALAAKVAALLRPGGRFTVAHGMGRPVLAVHHARVPATVTSELLPAADEAVWWRPHFDLDTLVDAPAFYCLAGTVK